MRRLAEIKEEADGMEVFKRLDNFWYWVDEMEMMHGGYRTRKDAERALRHYCKR